MHLELPCMQVMIANVWPEASHLEETVSTLRFASRVRLIETEAYVAESTDPSLLIKRWAQCLGCRSQAP